MRHWLTLATLLLVSLSSWGQHPDSVYTKDGIALPRHTPSKNIRPVYRNHFYHPDTLPCAAAPVLWVVAPSQFAATLQPFLQWKRQSGFRVDTVYVAASHCDSVHRLLQQRYDEAVAQRCAPDYVLVVGNASLIAPFPGRHRPSSELTNYYTDLYYGEFTGDFYPEAVVGRLPAANAEQLRVMIDKTLAYQQTAHPSNDHLQRVLLVAGKESLDPAPIVSNGQVNYVAGNLKTLYPEVDTVCFRNPASEHRLDEIVAHIRRGMGLVCYTAHGTIHGWHYPDYTYSIADTLSDTTSAIYINNCCYSNNFAVDCFGEHLLRKPLGGAVGVIGATNSTLWEEDYLWNVGARQDYSLTPSANLAHPGALDRYLWRHQLRLPQQAWTLGDLMHAGNYAVSEAGSVFEAYYWEIYNLLGDPTLMPIIGTPEALTVSATSPLQRGATTLTLEGTPDSYVAVSDNNGLLGSGWIESNGTVMVALAHGIATETILLTATKAGSSPFVATLHTVAPPRPRLSIMRYEREGDSLAIVLGNISSDTCFAHTVALLQRGDDSCGIRLVATAPAVLDTVAPQEQYALHLPLVLAETGQQPCLLFHIALSDDDGSYCQLQAMLPYPLSRPVLTDCWPLYQGGPVRRVTYGTAYTMAFAVTNPTDDTASVTIGEESSYSVAPRHRDTLYVPFVTPEQATQSHGSQCLSITMRCGAWRHDTVCCLSLDGDNEDFETGDLTAYPWDNTSSMQPWRIDADIHHSGGYSLRSGAIGNRQTSDLALTVYLPYSDTLTFYRRTSTEADYDHLLFYVDNTQYDGWSGQNGWTRARYVLPAGRHRLLWRYSKDVSGSQGDDCVWIDDLRFPLAVWDAAYGNGGAYTAVDSVAAPQWHLSLYPNPASGVVTLSGQLQSDAFRATLLDRCGRTIGSLKPGANNIQSLAAGVYFIAVYTAEQVHTLKLIVQ